MKPSKFMTSDFTVLIEGIGTATAISVLKGLSAQNEFTVRTIGVDMDDNAAGRHLTDVFYKIKPSKHSGYVDEVLDICKQEKVNVYIPIIDYGFKKLAKAKKLFQQNGIYVMIAEHQSVEICSDKFATYMFFLKKDIPTPKTWQGNSRNLQWSYPVIMKPRCEGRASIGVYVIDNETALQFYGSQNGNHILQEMIQGTEFTADCLACHDGEKFIDAFIRERIEIKSGLSVKGKMAKKEDILRIRPYLRKIIETLKIPGSCNIQGFMTSKGRVFFTEINPRFAGTHAFSVAAGLNSIHYLLQSLRGKSAVDIRKSITINSNIQMVRYWNEIFIDKKENKTWTWKNLLKN